MRWYKWLWTFRPRRFSADSYKIPFWVYSISWLPVVHSKGDPHPLSASLCQFRCQAKNVRSRWSGSHSWGRIHFIACFTFSSSASNYSNKINAWLNSAICIHMEIIVCSWNRNVIVLIKLQVSGYASILRATRLDNILEEQAAATWTRSGY